jgi:HD-GYP domain-containing protein (c-di-GMP phosphodiesterase class II)
VTAEVTSSERAVARGRRLVLVSGAIAVIVAAILTVYRPAMFANGEYAVYDSVLARAATNPPGAEVVIVDVDERSLSRIGQWPWRRDVVGRMIARVRESGAAAIALDVMFAEPDRHDESAEARGDIAFARDLREGRVVLGYAMTFDGSGRASSDCVLHPVGLTIAQRSDETAEAPFFRASGAICSLPALAQAAGASGFLNATPDRDGIMRRVPLLLELDGHVYPGLALAALISAKRTAGIALRVANVNTTSLSLGDTVAPLDGKSNLLVRYRGTKRTFPYVSAADVLEGRVPADTFREKVAFVGATALGTREVVATPMDKQFAGVEVQATVADNLLQRDFIRRPASAPLLEAGMAFVLGLMIVVFAGSIGLAWASVACAICLAIVWGGAVWLVSRHGIVLSPLFPSAGLAGALGAMIAVSVVTERRHAASERHEKTISQQLMIQALLSLTEARDEATGRHSRRTQRYARLLAEQLAVDPRFHDYLTPQRIELLARLAPLHDIGKVGVPDRLLNKSGNLTSDEYEEMKRHPARGREVIDRAERDVGAADDAILAMAKEIVYTHHERWDGTGYPQGLRGAQIPLAGRLMALVDVYDALVSKRVYRAALSPEEATKIIAEGSGTQFDPAVVDAFLHVENAFRRIGD